jgi:hypothetical protein
MRKVVYILGVAAFLLLNVSETFACMCAFSTPARAFARADVVFSGTISEAKRGRWKITVERVWKGEVEEESRLRNLSPDSGCAPYFTLGKRYIVFASIDASQREATYNPNVCSLTTPFKTYGQQDGEKGVRLMKDYDQTKTVYWVEDWLIQNLKELGTEKPPIKSKGEIKR